jgi:regulator of protease activity HflC (stomatin/prohibitin superfamily)
MHAQSGAERQRRARIIESEGERMSIQNLSEGSKLNQYGYCILTVARRQAPSRH